MIFIMLGPSGCGKGTQARVLAEKIGSPVVSSGEFLRRLAIAGDPRAIKAKEFVDRGEWPPFEIITGIVKSELDAMDLNKGLVMDGTPRTVDQVPWLDEYFRSRDFEITKVIHLETTLEESLRRIKGRVADDTKVGGVRSDDTDEAIEARFNSYTTTIQPIKDYYQKQGKLILINNEQSVEAVHHEICQKLGLL
jgi:adenylate kinase